MKPFHRRRCFEAHFSFHSSRTFFEVFELGEKKIQEGNPKAPLKERKGRVEIEAGEGCDTRNFSKLGIFLFFCSFFHSPFLIPTVKRKVQQVDRSNGLVFDEMEHHGQTSSKIVATCSFFFPSSASSDRTPHFHATRFKYRPGDPEWKCPRILQPNA